MPRNPTIDQAIEGINKAISGSSDPAVKEGLSKARILIARAIPDLEDTLSMVVAALDDASTVVDKREDEDYAYQAELDQAHSALSRLENMSYEPSPDSDLEFKHYTRIMEVGEGEARGVYVRMLGEKHDAIMAEVVVYGLVEGFSRAAGNDPGNYMRFHEHIHLNVGADLPEGLTAEALYEEAAKIADGDEMNGFSIQQMEEFSLEKGKELHTKLTATNSGPSV